jgi:AmmeMemoRadiSam system protein B/AmmeMemoRadiSam system protein A
VNSSSLVARPAAVAGLFYPAAPAVLRAAVRGLLDAQRPAGDGTPKVLVVPHAGYVYSGSTAARAYAVLRGAAAGLRRVVLIGPAHRVPVRGVALPAVARFETPLGAVDVDRPALDALAASPHVVVSDEAHAAEHALEVQLPFLQEVLGAFTVVPLVVGDAAPEAVAAVLERVWGGPETLVVVSSDLSHYLPYDTARAVDAATLGQVLALGPALDHEQACGATPINALLHIARARGLRPRLLAACNSGDTAGGRDRVVGYAALAFYGDAANAGAVDDGKAAHAGAVDGDGDPGPGATDHRAQAADDAARGDALLAHARHAIESLFGRPAGGALPQASFLDAPGATFVTLRRHGELRGCIGSLQPERPLREDVARNARAAALRDPRFAPLSGAELDGLSIEVSLLSAAQPLHFDDEADLLRQLAAERGGVVLEAGPRRSTFLPQVWEELPDPAEFLRHLKAKAGLAPDYWADDLRVSRYAVEKWSER